MSPVIRVSESTYRKLQLLATPFVDTPESVISQLLDTALDSQQRDKGPALHVTGSQSVPIAPGEHADLTHTKVVAAKFAGTLVTKPAWNQLVKVSHQSAMSRLGSLSELRKVSHLNMRVGRYEEEGFFYISEADISVQGMDSNMAWDNSLRVAKAISESIEVEFEWLNKKGAVRPGEREKFAWFPSES